MLHRVQLQWSLVVPTLLFFWPLLKLLNGIGDVLAVRTQSFSAAARLINKLRARLTPVHRGTLPCSIDTFMYALYLSVYLLRCRLLGRARRFGVHVRRRGAGHIVAAPARLQLVNCTVSNLRSLSKLRLHLILFIDCMGLAPTRPLAPSHSFPSPFNYRVERAVYTTGTHTHTHLQRPAQTAGQKDHPLIICYKETVIDCGIKPRVNNPNILVYWLLVLP